jgi:hypothetical protein
MLGIFGSAPPVMTLIRRVAVKCRVPSSQAAKSVALPSPSLEVAIRRERAPVQVRVGRKALTSIRPDLRTGRALQLDRIPQCEALLAVIDELGDYCSLPM